MRTWNFGKSRRATVFFRLCLVTIVALSLVMGGMALHPRPVRAAIGITAAPAAAISVPECQPFTIQFTATPGTTLCPPPPPPFFWTWGAIPAWMNFDWQTGLLTGCAPIGASTDPLNPFMFVVGVTEFSNNPPCPDGCPCSAATLVTITITGPVAPGTLDILPTYYPVAWEGLPFSMTLSATGCSGVYTWSATGLPAWATLDPATGIISGTPGPGTCNFADNVTVTCTNATCDPSCCPPVSRSFFLYVDCWANYLPIFYYTTACDFNVEIGPGLTQGQTNVVIDGTHEATLGGGQSQGFTSVPCESHTVMVDQTVQPNSNTRFSVIGSNMKTVTDVDNYAYFDYAQQVYITTASDPPGKAQPPGTGYYAVGSNFISTAPSTIESDIGNGIKYVFWEWQLPDGTTRPNVNLAFTVNQGGNVLAKYKTYYQLTLHSEYPAINETTFEPAGGTATWNLSLHAVPVESGFWAFLGVTQTPVNASGQQIMNGPSTVEIMWRPNYLPAIIAIVIILLVIAGLVYLIYRLRGRTRPATGTGVKEASSKAKKSASKNFCPKCGTPVDKDAGYCGKCGKKLR
jgi:hypothetical protein